jgi:hypothetical protein
MSVVEPLDKLVIGMDLNGVKLLAPVAKTIQNVKPCVKKKLSKSKLRGIGTTDKSFQQSKIIAPFKPKSNQNLVNLW